MPRKYSQEAVERGLAKINQPYEKPKDFERPRDVVELSFDFTSRRLVTAIEKGGADPVEQSASILTNEEAWEEHYNPVYALSNEFDANRKREEDLELQIKGLNDKKVEKPDLSKLQTSTERIGALDERIRQLHELEAQRKTLREELKSLHERDLEILKSKQGKEITTPVFKLYKFRREHKNDKKES